MSNIIITKEQRDLVNSGGFETKVNEALTAEGFDVKFDPTKGTVSKMIKASSQYNNLPEGKARNKFVNDVKAVLAEYHVGEYLVIWAVCNNMWARLNGVIAPKATDANQAVKQINISFMRADIAASPTAKGRQATVVAEKAKAEVARLAEENKLFRQRILEAGLDLPALEVIGAKE
jgi:hypothetical protein